MLHIVLYLCRLEINKKLYFASHKAWICSGRANCKVFLGFVLWMSQNGWSSLDLPWKSQVILDNRMQEFPTTLLKEKVIELDMQW